MLKTITVDVDIEEILDEVETEELVDALYSREDYFNKDEWDALYQHLCAGRDADAIVIMKKMVQERTGRIIP